MSTKPSYKWMSSKSTGKDKDGESINAQQLRKMTQPETLRNRSVMFQSHSAVRFQFFL